MRFLHSFIANVQAAVCYFTDKFYCLEADEKARLFKSLDFESRAQLKWIPKIAKHASTFFLLYFYCFLSLIVQNQQTYVMSSSSSLFITHNYYFSYFNITTDSITSYLPASSFSTLKTFKTFKKKCLQSYTSSKIVGVLRLSCGISLRFDD